MLWCIEPLLDQFPDDNYAIEGEALLLPVALKGQPKPSTTWFFEGSELTPGTGVEIQKDGSLFIATVQLKHTGLYQLVASNPVGSIEKSFNLYVKLRELRRITTMHNGTFLKPVPLEEFGAYVWDNHSQNNKGFRSQFMVKNATS